MSEEVLKPTREWIDGKAYTVHVSADGRTRINTGLDDQKPDADGLLWFTPICVAEYYGDDRVWTYHNYCGHCRKLMGSLGQIKERCPRCGAGIAHYIFAMGVLKFRLGNDWLAGMPDQLPDDAETQWDRQR